MDNLYPPLTFISNGSCLNHEAHNTCAFIKQDDTTFLFDCGTTVFQDLLKLDMLRSDFVVFITHLHADHVGGLIDLIYNSYFLRNGRRVRIVTAVEDIQKYLDICGVDRYTYVLDIEPTNEVYNVTDYLTIVPIEVEHSSLLKSYGYLVKYNDIRFWYSGDAKNIPDIILDDFLYSEINYIYQDVTLFENTIHMHFSTLKDNIRMMSRYRVFPMHLDLLNNEEIEKHGFSPIVPLVTK